MNSFLLVGRFKEAKKLIDSLSNTDMRGNSRIYIDGFFLYYEGTEIAKAISLFKKVLTSDPAHNEAKETLSVS